MIRVSVLYPQGSKFDFDYYMTKHMPMVAEKIGSGLIRWEMDKGIATNQPAPFVAIGHMYFNAVEDFAGAFGAHAQEIMADIPNYTDAQPQIQISEVVEG